MDTKDKTRIIVANTDIWRVVNGGGYSLGEIS